MLALGSFDTRHVLSVQTTCFSIYGRANISKSFYAFPSEAYKNFVKSGWGVSDRIRYQRTPSVLSVLDFRWEQEAKRFGLKDKATDWWLGMSGGAGCTHVVM